ncbi:MAG: nucleotidyltransferase family protein [Cyclobacteriaceae bacterium]|nr:nucleotidyltransferase family protein [Cyclobacteriaceae bacterium]
MNDHPNIAIIILAAGASTRMGEPKQLLTWGNTTLLNHTIEQAVNSKSDAVYIVLGANYTAIKKSIIRKQATILYFKNWQEGMGSSIAYGVQNLPPSKFDGILIMLADQPQIDSLFFNKLINEFKKGSKPIIATKYEEKVGVPAIFNASFFNQLTQLEGEKGGKLLLEKNLKNLSLLLPNSTYEDIDTQEDYKKLVQLFTTASLPARNF